MIFQNHEVATMKRAFRSSPETSLGIAVLMLLTVALALTFAVEHVYANPLAVTTTDVDNAQFGVPYFFQLTSDTVAPNTYFTVTSGAASLAAAGLSINSAGQITGIPTLVTPNLITGATVTFSVSVSTNIVPFETSVPKVFTMTIAGKTSFNFASTSDTTVTAGSTNVGIGRFVMQAQGEDIRLDSIKFYGVGSGSDTFDIEANGVKLWRDENRNGLVDAGDVLLKTASFVTTAGFNPSVTFENIGSIIDSNADAGFDTFLVSYNFKNTVEPGRTFRLAFETPGDITWSCRTSLFVSNASLSGGDPQSQQTVVSTGFLGAGFPYKSGVITITGTPPLVPTLFVSDDGVGLDTVNVAAGATNQAALSLHFWADSGHTIILDRIVVSDSGSGIASSQIENASLYYDLDKDAAFSASDVLLKSDSFVGDAVTFNNLSLSVTTPSGLPTDPSAVRLIVTYSFKSSIPVTNPPLTFQALVVQGASFFAHDQVTAASAAVLDTGTSPGNVFRIVSGTLSSLFVDSGAGLFSNVNVANNVDSIAVWRGRFYADSGHSIRLTSLKFTPSGNLDDEFDISSVKLIKDRDNSGSVTQGDVTLFSTTSFANDNDSMVMSGLNEIIRTPTGTSSDSNVLNLLVVYKLNGNAPVIAPPIQFSLALLSTNDITANVYGTSETISFVTGPPINGRTITVDSIGTISGASVSGGPFPISASFIDVDTSGTVTVNDIVIVAFDTNLLSSSAASAGDFELPVLSDALGGGAGVSFLGGNKMQILIGTAPKLTITGAYALGSHATDSPSGINLRDSVLTTIKSFYGANSSKATLAVDITGTLVGGTTSGPYPISAVYSDADTTYGVSQGDQIIVSFSENITLGALTTNPFSPLPVIGDFFGAVAPAISQTAGNKLTITFTSLPVLTPTGTFSAASLGVGSPSGINLTAITTTIRDSAGRAAVPAAVAVDVGGGDTGNQDSAPIPISAVFYDRDSDGVVSSVDVIDLAFSKNIVLTSLPANKISLPVLGDLLASASVEQTGGNLLRITVGAPAVFRVSGTFSAATLTATSPSGINLTGPISTIQDLQGRSATAATAAVDITAGTSGFSDVPGAAPSGGSGTSAQLQTRGDKACLVSRVLPASGIFGWLRVARDAALETSLGRWLVGAYYAL
jgi:hypothetical protein